MSASTKHSKLVAVPCRNRNTYTGGTLQYTDDQPAVLFLVAGVFVSGGRDGSIMVWDTRCSTKGNLYLLHVGHVREGMVTLISKYSVMSVFTKSIHVM